LSYKIVGVLFRIHSALGSGYQEKYYQKAIATELKKQNISFKEQVCVPLMYSGESIGRYFIDFVINEKIILEIKAAQKFYARDIRQVLAYLKQSDIQLGIVANFGKEKLEYKRILKGK